MANDPTVSPNMIEISLYTSRFLEVNGARVEDLRARCALCGASAPVPLDLTTARPAIPLNLPHLPDCDLVFAYQRAVAAHLS